MTNHWQIIESVLEDERDRHIINGGKAEHRKELDAALAFVREQQLAEREDTIAALESKNIVCARLANKRLEELQLAERSEWEVVPPGLHYIEWGDTAMTVALDGTLLTMRALDEETYPELSIQLDPNEYRLCRRVQGGDENE